MSSSWEYQQYLNNQIHQDYQLLNTLQNKIRYEDDPLRKGRLEQQIQEVEQKIRSWEESLNDQRLSVDKSLLDRRVSQRNSASFLSVEAPCSQAKPVSTKQVVNVFISCTSKDATLRQKFEEICLSSLEQEGVISVWHEGRIRPGANRKIQTDEKLNSCHLFLPLVTPNYANSYNRKLEDIYRQACIIKQQSLTSATCIIPVLLKRTPFLKKLEFGELQHLPHSGEAVDSRAWKNQNQAFCTIAEELEKEIQKLLAELVD